MGSATGSGFVRVEEERWRGRSVVVGVSMDREGGNGGEGSGRSTRGVRVGPGEVGRGGFVQTQDESR